MVGHLTGQSVDKLRAISRKMGTTALVVLDDGEAVAEAGAVGRRIELMSVTKSVVSLHRRTARRSQAPRPRRVRRRLRTELERHP
jgi:hypothetical protein